MGTAMLVPLCFLVAAWSYPLAVNFAPRYKAVVDAFSSTEVGVQDDGAEDPEKAKASIEETAAAAHDNSATIR